MKAGTWLAITVVAAPLYAEKAASAGALLAQLRPGIIQGVQQRTQTGAPGSQTPATAAAPARAATQAPSGAGARQRDPFRPIVVKRPQAEEAPTRLPAGKKGLVIGQLNLTGIVRGIDGEWIAVVDNKTKRAYFLHEKDEVYNGVVSKITEDSVVFEERVADALGRTRAREVVKRLARD